MQEEEGDWRELNRVMWDAKTPAHLRSPLYNVDGFKAGQLSLQPHEIRDLGDLRGKTLVHLQCHIGLDTLSWARLGAIVTGLDFSKAAVEAARDIARELELEATFVAADVYDAPATLQATYDVVYTGVGALCWLPDMDKWAAVVRQLLRPGGELYLFEFHPTEWVLEGGPHGVEVRYDYFTGSAGFQDGGAVSYADGGASSHRTVQWNHPLGEVVTALARAGLQITELRELDREVLRRWDFMQEAPDGMFRMPDHHPNLPLMYVLRAKLPEDSSSLTAEDPLPAHGRTSARVR